MSHPSSPSPQGENAMTQDEEIEQIASQMDWNDHGDAQDESGDDEGPQIGRGAYVGGVWQDPLDSHLFLKDKDVQGQSLFRITFRVQFG